MKSKFARNTKHGQMEGSNNFSCGGQFLEKLLKYTILPNLKFFLKLMGPPVTNIAPPLAIGFSTNIRFYEYYRVGQS